MVKQLSSSPPQSVETERLLLRPFVDDDFVAYERIRANPEVARYLPGGIAAVKSAPERARQTIQGFARHWRERGFGPWAVIDNQTRVLIGHCGLRYLSEFDAIETRRKLGLGPDHLPEFHIMLDFENLSHLDAAFHHVSTRSNPVESFHQAVNAKVKDLIFALYRDFPDPGRVRGQEKF